MDERSKPFACDIVDCGMSFTNEDHLNVHRKKHDMMLQLGVEQKAAFIADQTPTPTRFIRNCEEVGLFQELQNVNPFDEGFKKAMENQRTGMLLENTMSPLMADDVLHTPQMMFPSLADNVDSALYSTTNNKKNIIVGRSSRDESAVVKEYETTTISKCTNEVTISRVAGKPDALDKVQDGGDISIVRFQEITQNKDVINETLSFTNNVIKIHSNLRKADSSVLSSDATKSVPLICYDHDSKDASVIVHQDVMLTDDCKLQAPNANCKIPPIMSQKSLDFVVDSLTCEVTAGGSGGEKNKDVQLIQTLKNNFSNSFGKKSSVIMGPHPLNDGAIRRNNEKLKPKPSILRKRRKSNDNDKPETLVDSCEVLIKFRSGKCVRMKPVDEDGSPPKDETKNILKKAIEKRNAEKNRTPVLQPELRNIQASPLRLPVAGTLIPVTVLNASNTSIILPKQIATSIPISVGNLEAFRTPKNNTIPPKQQKNISKTNHASVKDVFINLEEDDEECVIVDKEGRASNKLNSKSEENKINKCRRKAASKRYRDRMKVSRMKVGNQIKQLTLANERLARDNAILKMILLKHMEKCLMAEDLRELQMKLQGNLTEMNVLNI